MQRKFRIWFGFSWYSIGNPKSKIGWAGRYRLHIRFRWGAGSGAAANENRAGRISDWASLSSQSGRIEALRQGLRDPGYVEEKNIVFEWRWEEGKIEFRPPCGRTREAQG